MRAVSGDFPVVITLGDSQSRFTNIYQFTLRVNIQSETVSSLEQPSIGNPTINEKNGTNSTKEDLNKTT